MVPAVDIRRQLPIINSYMFSFIYWTQYCVTFSSGARLSFRTTNPCIKSRRNSTPVRMKHSHTWRSCQSQRPPTTPQDASTVNMFNITSTFMINFSIYFVIFTKAFLIINVPNHIVNFAKYVYLNISLFG